MTRALKHTSLRKLIILVKIKNALAFSRYDKSQDTTRLSTKRAANLIDIYRRRKPIYQLFWSGDAEDVKTGH